MLNKTKKPWGPPPYVRESGLMVEGEHLDNVRPSEHQGSDAGTVPSKKPKVKKAAEKRAEPSAATEPEGPKETKVGRGTWAAEFVKRRSPSRMKPDPRVSVISDTGATTV